jgi:hypothetical protein
MTANMVIYSTLGLGAPAASLMKPPGCGSQTAFASSGTILVEAPEQPEKGAVLYSQVSLVDQRYDLNRRDFQHNLKLYATERGHSSRASRTVFVDGRVAGSFPKTRNAR